MIGAIPFLWKDPLGFVARAQARYGDIYVLDLGITQMIALNKPEHAQHVLRDHARNYYKGGPLWESTRDMVGNGLASSEGDFWLRQRRTIQPQFHKASLTAMGRLMNQAIDENLKEWDEAAESGKPVDVARLLAHLTMSVAVKTMFSSRLSSEESDRIAKEMRYALSYIMVGLFAHSLPAWIPFPGRRRFHQAVKTIDEMVFQLIESSRVADPESTGDLVGLLMNAVDPDTGQGMSAQQLRDEVVTLFLAGYETTSFALSCALALLTERQDAAQSIREEYASVVGQGHPEFSHLPHLDYTRMVFQEALRLYPSGFWIPRVAKQEDMIDGFHVPAGSMVTVMAYAIHQRPDIWEEPERFDPLRFTQERSANRHPLAWVPFGAGQRMCVGRDFAHMEGQFTLGRLLSRFDFEPVKSERPRVIIGGALRVRDGVWMRLRKRT